MHVIKRDNNIRSLVIIIFSIGILHCERNDYVTLPDAKLAFSTDTILFDTVITNTTFFVDLLWDSRGEFFPHSGEDFQLRFLI